MLYAPHSHRPKFDYLSISTLFSLLISSPPNPHYPYTFLLTYRMFTNAHEVLDALLEGHRKELDLRSSPNHKGGVSRDNFCCTRRNYLICFVL